MLVRANNNSASAQQSYRVLSHKNIATISDNVFTAHLTSAINSAADQNLIIQTQLDNNGDTITITAVEVEVVKP